MRSMFLPKPVHVVKQGSDGWHSKPTVNLSSLNILHTSRWLNDPTSNRSMIMASEPMCIQLRLYNRVSHLLSMQLS